MSEYEELLQKFGGLRVQVNALAKIVREELGESLTAAEAAIDLLEHGMSVHDARLAEVELRVARIETMGDKLLEQVERVAGMVNNLDLNGRHKK